MIEYEEIITEESNVIRRIPIREVEHTELREKINKAVRDETKKD